MQRGQVFRQDGSWYVRYYQNETKDGALVRRRVCERLARYSAGYRTHYIVVDRTEAKDAMKKLEKAVGKEWARAKRLSVSK
jgi:hypothetical protein